MTTESLHSRKWSQHASLVQWEQSPTEKEVVAGSVHWPSSCSQQLQWHTAFPAAKVWQTTAHRSSPNQSIAPSGTISLFLSLSSAATLLTNGAHLHRLCAYDLGRSFFSL